MHEQTGELLGVRSHDRVNGGNGASGCVSGKFSGLRQGGTTIALRPLSMVGG